MPSLVAQQRAQRVVSIRTRLLSRVMLMAREYTAREYSFQSAPGFSAG